MDIKAMLPEHRGAVKKIYEEGIATGHATFQATAPDWSKWDASHLAVARLVAIENEEVVGWAALSPVSGRCVYAGVAEVSIYVSERARGRGVGRKLLAALVDESERHNFWTLQAGIFPENNASIRIHEENGFRIIGTRERIGKMGSAWRDTLLLERRSKKVGTD